MAGDSASQVCGNGPADIPLYRLIEEDLRSQISGGALQPGDMVPTERELCRQYGVSRITVRRAISELETRGYVRRQQGKGTFVSRSRIQREMGRLLSFSEEMRALGHSPGSKLINLQHRLADDSIASLLHLEKGAAVWIVERLRLADDEIVSVSISYLNLPPDVYLTPTELNGTSSLWTLLESKDLHIELGRTTVRAMTADSHYAELLGIAEGEPLLVREGVNFTVRDQPVPIEAFEVVSRADRYQYSLQLVRQAI